MTAWLLPAALLGVLVTTFVASAEGIDPGLWKIVTRVKTGGVLGPPLESAKCLSSDQARDVENTFSPVARTVNSDCAPIERSLVGTSLKWKLVCKGQLDMELAGEFTFDSPRHYTASVRNKAQMAGAEVANSETTIEAEWVSGCQ